MFLASSPANVELITLTACTRFKNGDVVMGNLFLYELGMVAGAVSSLHRHRQGVGR